MSCAVRLWICCALQRDVLPCYLQGALADFEAALASDAVNELALQHRASARLQRMDYQVSRTQPCTSPVWCTANVARQICISTCKADARKRYLWKARNFRFKMAVGSCGRLHHTGVLRFARRCCIEDSGDRASAHGAIPGKVHRDCSKLHTGLSSTTAYSQ